MLFSDIDLQDVACHSSLLSTFSSGPKKDLAEHSTRSSVHDIEDLAVLGSRERLGCVSVGCSSEALMCSCIHSANTEDTDRQTDRQTDRHYPHPTPPLTIDPSLV